MTLAVGTKAPDFTLPRDDGGVVALSALKGGPVVLFFYPKALTSGCTVEARDFSALMADFKVLGANVVGLSADPVKKLDAFRTKESLQVILAGDETQQVLAAYGVWAEKSMYGRKYMGIERTTYLIDGEGVIVRIWPKVKIAGHAQEVLAAVRVLVKG